MSEEKHRVAAIPTHVRGSVDKTGRERPAHIAVRHKKVTGAADPPGDTPLDAWIAKHGGCEHLRTSLEEMTAEQRAKLLDAMAHVGGTTAADVMKKLGIHEPQASADEKIVDEAVTRFTERLAQARDESIITPEEFDAVTDTLEEDGIAAALEQLVAIAASRTEAVASTTVPDAPVVAIELDSSGLGAAQVNAATNAAAQEQADSLFETHVDLANKAHRQAFEIQKRMTRGWKVPAQMTEAAEKFAADAVAALTEWRAFCEANRLSMNE